ncbi:MAG: LD-carboxypeptidase [Alphaproteobacteria bacterium]|nr:LD-carboxypeptidase [Alphaproteobacteria bacterium]
MNKLVAGDKVAIVAPCGQIGEISKIEQGLNYLRQLGFQPVLGKHIFAVNRYMAGTDEQRAEDINIAFCDPQIKALFCVRAAAGGSRILPYIDYETAQKNPKPVIGFCDNVAVQLALYQKSGIHSINGFNLTYDFRDGVLDPLISETLQKNLKEEKMTIHSGDTIHGGTAEGQLIVSNLSVLLRLAGTEYFPDLSGKILLIEDVHERIHKIDLMLQQLKQQPDFKNLKGIIFGQFTDCTGDTEDGTVKDCINDFLQGVDLPTVNNFNFGHTKSRYVLPLGADVCLCADTATLEIIRR